MDEEAMTQEEMDRLVAQWRQEKLAGKVEEPTGMVIGPLAGEEAVRFLEMVFPTEESERKL